METLRRGRRKGIKFDVVPRTHHPNPHLRPAVEPSQEQKPEETVEENEAESKVKPGQCASCYKAFHQDEKETLVGFACGHVYHVSHLLHGPDAQGDETRLPQSAAAQKDGDDEASIEDIRFSRSVAPKVTNARLLKEKIQAVGGCLICKESRIREAAVS